MGLMSFIKDAGEKLFGKGEAKAAQEAVQKAPTADNVAKLNAAAGDAIEAYVESQGLTVSGLDVQYDGATQTVTVSGEAPDQATKEKVLLCCGNVQNVAAVNDMLTVVEPTPEAQWYTVVKGDTLSKISKEYYGSPNEYMKIFEANKPMLSHPDKIYPGQMLRIPPKA
jgi:nucleoid-associated protein YgaU